MKQSNIVGIYLAAGNSIRMGSDKLRLPLGGHPLGLIALTTALKSNLKSIIVVKKPGSLDNVSPSQKEIIWTECPSSTKGLSFSLNHGINVAKKMNPDGALIFLADQPFITKNLLDDLIDHFYKNENAHYIASCFDGTIRPPLIIRKNLFLLLKQLKGDEGVKKLIQTDPAIKGQTIQYDQERWFYDIDTIDDYVNSLRLFNVR